MLTGTFFKLKQTEFYIAIEIYTAVVTLNDLQWIPFGPAPVTPLLRGWADPLKNVLR